jgi:hypothetical protein
LHRQQMAAIEPGEFLLVIAAVIGFFAHCMIAH